MGLLDFIKNRQSQQQPATAQPKPETAKEMYTREASQEQVAAKPLDRIPSDQMAKVDGIKADLQRATQGGSPGAPSVSPTQADATANPQPMAQMSMNQDTAAPALSPTSAQAGARMHEQDSPASADPKPEKSQDRAQTIARRPPSWER
jgi:hypothetical protein